MSLLALLALPLALAADTPLQAGPLTLEIHISRTAHLFHVVDQLSSWDVFTHAQYREHIDHDRPGDGRALRRHGRIRRSHGWGGGLEQTFYTGSDLDAAIAAGIAASHLSPREGRLERRILLRFALRVEQLMAEQQPVLLGFQQQIAHRLPELESFADRLARFCTVEAVHVPVYLLANPDEQDFGGGYNGGSLTIEVASGGDAWGIFLHEVLHAFIEPAWTRLEAAAAGVEGLDAQTLNEAIAYAIYPGLINEGGDPLADAVARLQAGGRGLDDPYFRFNRLALAIRDPLAESLAGEGTLDEFLPVAVAAWKEIHRQ